MTLSLSQAEVAERIGRSYDWFRRHWRSLPDFPAPYLGGGPGERPRWSDTAIEAFMNRHTAPQALSRSTPQPAPPPAVRRTAANDRKPSPVDQLLTWAGS